MLPPRCTGPAGGRRPDDRDPDPASGGCPRRVGAPPESARASRVGPAQGVSSGGLGPRLAVPLLPELFELRRRGLHRARVLAGAGADGAPPAALPALRAPRCRPGAAAGARARAFAFAPAFA